MWWVVDIVLCVVVDFGCLFIVWLDGGVGGLFALGAVVGVVVTLLLRVSLFCLVVLVALLLLLIVLLGHYVLQFGALLFRIGCYFVYSVGVAKFALVAGGWYMCWGLFLDCLVCFGW